MPVPPAPSNSLPARVVRYLAGLFARLLDIKDRPHAIAGGVAIGMFVGFTPLFGLKTLLCLGLAFLLGCNPIAAVIAVSLHDVVTPFWPFLLMLEYEIGTHILGHTGETSALLHSFHHLHLMDMMKWTTFLDVGLPLLVGSMFLSAPAAAIAYFLMIGFLKRRERRRLEREKEAAE